MAISLQQQVKLSTATKALSKNITLLINNQATIKILTRHNPSKVDNGAELLKRLRHDAVLIADSCIDRVLRVIRLEREAQEEYAEPNKEVLQSNLLLAILNSIVEEKPISLEDISISKVQSLAVLRSIEGALNT